MKPGWVNKRVGLGICGSKNVCMYKRVALFKNHQRHFVQVLGGGVAPLIHWFFFSVAVFAFLNDLLCMICSRL